MRIVLLQLFLFVTISIHAQYRSISEKTVFGVRDGLADRVVLDVSTDELDNYYIHTPISIHKYADDRIQETIKLNSYNQNIDPIRTTEHFLIIDKELCLTVINISQFRITASHCLKGLLDGDIILVDAREDKVYVLTEEGQSKHSYYEVKANDEDIQIIAKIEFHSDDNILAVQKRDVDEVLYITDKDELKSSLSGLLYKPTNGKKFPEMNTPRLHKSSIREEVFFSFGIREGLYSIQGDEIKKIWEQGFLDIVSSDEQNNLVLGLTGEVGLHIDNLLVVTESGEINTLNHLLVDNQRLLQIRSKDFQENALLCTYNGLYVYTYLPQGIESFLQKPDIPYYEFGNVVRSFTVGDDGIIKIVKENGECDIHEIVDGRPLINKSLSDRFGRGTMWIEYVPEKHTYWVLMYNTNKTSTLSSYNHLTDRITNHQVPLTGEKFHLTKEGIWIIGRDSNNGRIIKLDDQTGSQELMWESHLENRNVRASFFTDSIYLFGTRAGLLVYNPITQQINEKLFQETSELYISNIRKYNDEYWVGTYNKGLYIYDESFSLLQQVNIGSTTASNTAASMERDTYDNTWISTFDGISIINNKRSLSDRIDYQKGLYNTEYNRDASFKHEDYIYFGNINGYTRIDPTLYFSDISTQNIRTKDITYNVYSQDIIETVADSIIHLSGPVKNLTLNYQLPGFTNKQRNPNLSKKNIEVSPLPDSITVTDHEIHLSGLGYENYQIRLIPTDINKTPINLGNIQITRDYGNIISRIVYISIAVLLGLLLSRFIIRRNNRAYAEKMSISKELSNTRMKALRSQLNPHFVFNSLNSIQYYIQVNEKKLARNYLSKFARLMRLVLESSNNDLIPLNQEIEQLTVYLELEKMRFEDKWNYNIFLAPDVDGEQIFIPPMILQPIIENSIVHGLGHRHDNQGMLNINFKDSEAGIIIEIDDNGIGREAADKMSSTSLNKHNSLSTLITKERVELYNQSNKEELSIEYVDKMDKEGSAIGTLARIKLST